LPRRDLFPSTATGLWLAAATAVPFAIRLLGEQGARLGPFRFPDFDPIWLGVPLLAAALLAPRSPHSATARQIVVRGLVLGALAWPVMELRGLSLRSDNLLEASIGRDRVAGFDLSEASRRLPVRRLAGRRRDVRLEIRGYLRALENGEHFFDLSSDGSASLEIDGRKVDSAPIRLERGLHQLAISYQRGTGPAFLDLTWDRPALFEPLPITAFTDALPGRIDARSIRWAELGSMLSFAVALAWWSLLSSFVVRLLERLPSRRWLTRPAVLVFASAVFFFTLLFALLRPRDEDDPFYARTSSEFMMQTVSVADLRDQPLRSLWYLHIQPPAFDALRAILAQLRWNRNDEELLRGVDGALRVVFALLYGGLAALICLWLGTLLGTRLAVAASLGFALHPGLVLYATWLDSTLLSTVLFTWFCYELWKAGAGHGSTVKLVAAILALFFTRSLFQWPFLLVVSLSLWLAGFSRRRLVKVVAVAGLVVGLHALKQYWLFGTTSTSSFAGYNGCRSIGASVSWDTRDFAGNIRPLPPPRAARVLSRDTKVNGEYNFNQLQYLRISFALMERYLTTLATKPLAETLIAYRENLRIYLLPSSRYEESPIVRPLPWRRPFDTITSGSVFVVLLLLSAATWLVANRESMARGIAMAIPALYVVLASIVFESGENMRFRFFVEPVLYLFVVIQLTWVFQKLTRSRDAS
jgi:hypothetical protein